MLPKRRKVDEDGHMQHGGVPTVITSSDRSRKPLQRIKASSKESQRKFQIIRKLGNGTFGHVFLVESVAGEHLALKRVRKFGDEVSQEVEIMKRVGTHPNLVRMRDWFLTRDKDDNFYLNIVSDYAGSTSLHDVIGDRGPLGASKVREMLFQLLLALSHVHSRGVIHRDLKPSNIMIDECGTLRVIDFGSATISMTDRKHACYVVSRYYRAPELLMGAERYSDKIDMWSVGCIVWEMLVGEAIFTGMDTADQLLRIASILGTPTANHFKSMGVKDRSQEFPKLAGLDFKTLIPSSLSDVADIIASLLQYDPAARPSASELLKHRFFTDDGDGEDAGDDL